MWLHIGGEHPDPDWRILNIAPGPHVDFVGNAIDLGQFADESIERIYASHILEHLGYRQELPTALKEWHRVLKPGGTLMASVPDLGMLCRLYLREDLTHDQRVYAMRMIYGGQEDEHDFHKVGFCFEHLASFLYEAGFEIVYPVEGFGLFNDTSCVQVLGEPLSLNVEAIKGPS